MSSAFRGAIFSQPENLVGAREARLAALDQRALRAMDAGTVVFSGIGASGHALTPAVLALRAGGRRVFAIAPGELRAVRAAGIGDAFVLVSQSGASAETLQALE